jgi:high-affinity K+ transport system ATPase subunit B
MTEEQQRKQRHRNIALAVFLAGLVVLFFVITMARIGGVA